MTLATATYAYYVDWNNDGDFADANEDVTSYVLSAQWEYGVDWSSTPGRSKIGACRIKLDNSTGIFSSYNAASPLNTLILPGRAVKVTMTIAPAAAVTMWYGYLESLIPSPGIVVGVSTADLLAYGPLSQISDTEVHLALQTNHTTGALVTHILDAASYSAGLRSIDTGLSTLSKFFVLRDSSALGVLRELEDAECGLIRETKDGKIAFEDRAHRINAPHDAAIATFGSGGLYTWNLSQEDPLNGIYNAIQTQVRTFNESEDVQLSVIVDVRNGLGGSAISIAGSGGTRTVRIEFPTETSSSAYIAVKTWGIVTYEANTAADISGTDITTDVSAVKTEYADHIQIVFTNANASAGYIVVLKANGTAIVEGDPIPVKDSDATSQGKYRIRNFPSPSRWMTDIDVAEAYCAHLLAIYKDPVPKVSFELKANYNAAHLAQSQSLDVSDRIHIDATATLYSLGLSQDFFIEYVRHRVDSNSIHSVQYECRAVAAHTWAASGVSYTSKVVVSPSSNVVGAKVPDDLWVTAISNGLKLLFGGLAWKWNANIDQAEFRAKYFTERQTYADLRTVAEGGTLAHNGTTQYVVTGLGANYDGCQYKLTSASQGCWHYAFRFRNAAGWSVWSDGNDTPSYVKDWVVTEDASLMSDGPPQDWTVTVADGPTGTVIVSASRPKINGEKILWFVVQIKNITTSPIWHAIDSDPVAEDNDHSYQIGEVFYDGASNAHTYNKTAGTLTTNRANWADAAEGDTIIMDVRDDGSFDRQYCQWAMIPTGAMSGTTISGLYGFRPYPDPDVGTDQWTNIRCRIIGSIDEWGVPVHDQGWGYLGAEPNRGIWYREYWSQGQGGDTTTDTFISDPIEIPAGLTAADIGARVFFENVYSRADDDIYSNAGSGQSGGCIALDITGGSVATDAKLGRKFFVEVDDDFTLEFPTGLTKCGQVVVWFLKQTGSGGAITLADKFDICTEIGEVILSTGEGDVDALGGVYLEATGNFHILGFVHMPKVASASPSAMSASASASVSASPSNPSVTPSSSQSASPSNPSWSASSSPSRSASASASAS